MTRIGLRGTSMLALLALVLATPAATAATRSPATLGPGQFVDAPVYPTTAPPAATAIGDFTGDGIPDVVSTGTLNDTDSVSVQAGLGAGALGSPVNTPTRPGPVGLATADFDRNGTLDVATADFGDNGEFSDIVTVLLGKGDGKFISGPDLTAAPFPNSVASGDLNGDGIADLVAGTSEGVVAFLGVGDGTFGTGFEVNDATPAESVTVADVNRDGFADAIAVAPDDNAAQVFLGNGDGTLQAATEYAVGADPVAVAVADTNGDGKPDIVTADSDGHAVSLLLGTGHGFRPHADLPANGAPEGVGLADLNGDGSLDLVIREDAGGVGVRLGNGIGGFLAEVTYSVTDVSSMSLGDLDQDGSPDVVLGASVTPPGVAVLLGRGDGTLKARQDVAVGADPLSVVLSDFDADHVFDMATANSLDDQVQVLFGRGDGTFGSSRTYDVGRSPAFVAAADLNGDRRNDLLVADSRSPDLEVLLNQGDGTFGTPVRYQSGTDPVSIATADLNHDGAIDVVLANTAREGSVAVLLGNGDGTLQPPVFFGAGQFPASVVAVDLNGDRIPDLAVADSNPLGTPTNTVSVLIGDGAGNFARRVAYSVGPSPRNPVWVAAGDLNGDGFPDLAVANLYGGFLSVLLNQGDGTFGHHVDSRGGGGGVALGDFDGDGILDALVTTGVFGSSLQLLPGNGDGTFGRAILFQTGQSPLQVVVGDVNRDDLPDAVTVNAVGNTVSVLLNTGSVGSS